MKVRAVFGNPYRESLLRTAFNRGRWDRLRKPRWGVGQGWSERVKFAYRAGFEGRGWHRSPNGQVKWHKGGA